MTGDSMLTLRRCPFFQSSNAERAALANPLPHRHALPMYERLANPRTRQPDTVGPRNSQFYSEIRNPLNILCFPKPPKYVLRNIKPYRNWEVGRNSPVRRPQPTDGDPNFLEEDFSNLALVVNDLLSRRMEPSLDSYLKRFYESYESLHPRIFGNTVEPDRQRNGHVWRAAGLPTIRWHHPLHRPAGHPVPPKPAAAHLHRGTGNRLAPRLYRPGRRTAPQRIRANAADCHHPLAVAD